MHVIGHQTIGENLHASAPATLSQEIDIERIIRRPEECRQSPVSPLRDMMRDPPGQQCVRCVAWTHPSTEGEETQEQKWNIAGFLVIRATTVSCPTVWHVAKMVCVPNSFEVKVFGGASGCHTDQTFH